MNTCPPTKKPFLCRTGLWHSWLFTGHEDILYPKAGPYDPRTDEQRTYRRDMQVCVNCGEKREMPDYWSV